MKYENVDAPITCGYNTYRRTGTSITMQAFKSPDERVTSTPFVNVSL